MEITLLLELNDRSELRQWLSENHDSEKEVWVSSYRGKIKPDYASLAYLDIVEEALCFGWIDSTLKRLPDGRLAQRISPRRKNSHWTELNIQRCLSLIEKGLMTDIGREIIPNLPEIK